MWAEALKNDTRYVLLMLLISFTTMFQLGYVYGYPNTAFSGFKDYVNDSYSRRGDDLSESAFNWIWSAILSMWSVGFLFGTFSSPFVAEKYGRKAGIILGNGIDFLATAIVTVSIVVHVPELMGVGRLFLGLGDGIAANCLTLFLQESSPTQIRGLVSGFQELSCCLSLLLGLIMGTQSLLGDSLLILSGLAAIPNIIAVIVLLFCPDSPKFLYLNKLSEKETIASLRFYRRESGCNIKQSLDSFSKEKNSEKSTLREIWKSDSLRKATILGSVVFSLQSFTGIMPIILFSSVFFRDVGLSVLWAEYFTIAMIVVEVLGTTLSLNYVDKFGRRTLLLWFGGLNVLSTIIYVVLADIVPSTELWAKYGCAAALIVFNAAYSFSLGPIPWYLTAELVPQHQRSLVQSIAYACNTIVAFGTSLLSLPAYGYMNAYSFIPIFIVPSVICLIYLYRELPETKNKEIFEVVQKLKKGGHVQQQESE